MSPADDVFQPGDIAVCFGRDIASRVVSTATLQLAAPAGLRWGPSHVAILSPHAGDCLWVESTTLAARPCLIQGRCVSGVQAHRPVDRIGDYSHPGGRVDLYRLVDIEMLAASEVRLLAHILFDHFLARSVTYDLCGALLSGTRVFQLTRFFPGADFHQLFCSELVAAVLMRLGRLGRGNPTRYPPARLLRALVRNGTYRRCARWEGVRR